MQSAKNGIFSIMIETLGIERMTFVERLQAMGWHKKILARRLAKVEAGKGEFLTLTQLTKRLQ
jgi:hypothetical protein